MSGSFIDQARSNYANRGTAYEDFLVAAEIAHVKRMIEYAIKNNRNSFVWAYSYDDYESFTSQIDDLYNGAAVTVKQLFDNPSDVGIFSNGGLCDFLTRELNGTGYQTPPRPGSLNFEYIAKTLERELYKLGCRSVRVMIGPQRVSYRKFLKKGFLQDKYEDAVKTVTAWVVSVSW